MRRERDGIVRCNGFRTVWEAQFLGWSFGIWLIVFALSRFIPNREGQDLQASYSLLHEDGCPTTPSKAKKRAPHGELHFQKSKCGCA